jgi:hypothetical protein
MSTKEITSKTINGRLLHTIVEMHTTAFWHSLLRDVIFPVYESIMDNSNNMVFHHHYYHLAFHITDVMIHNSV